MCKGCQIFLLYLKVIWEQFGVICYCSQNLMATIKLTGSFLVSINETKSRDTRCDKSLRHVAATGCCNKSPRLTCENHCRCDRIAVQSRRGDLSPRRDAAICRIVCLSLKSHAVIFSCWWLFSTTKALLILITTVGFVTTVVKYSCSYAGQ